MTDIPSFLENEEWKDYAACKGMGPELFFPERGQSHAPGKRVCARCPVTAQCTQYADDTGSEHGMWGGVLRSRGNWKTPQPDIEEIMKPTSVSASSIQVYLKCPARWKAEYLDRGRGPSGAAASIGTVCHTVMELWVADGHYKADYSRPKQLDVARALYDEAYWREFDSPERYDDGWDMVAKWLNRQDWTGRTVVSTELKESYPLVTPAGEIGFTYILDRLDVLDDGDIEIVDYKSLSAPMPPAQLKLKPQPRLYALMAQLKYPNAERIWMTFDMLRHDPIGIVFTKEDNRRTWTWLHQITETILNDTEWREILNEECRWCIRKHECTSLTKHVDVGGPLGIVDPSEAAVRHFEISQTISALEIARNELERFLIEELKRTDEFERDIGTHTVKVTVSSRRSVDAGRLRGVIGEEILGRYGSITMERVKELLKSDEITVEQKSEIRQLVQQNFGDPRIRVDRKDEFVEHFTS